MYNCGPESSTANRMQRHFALLHRFRRLRIRWEIRDDIREAFLGLARDIMCWRRLGKLSFR
jgi:hypothetical protein